MYVVLDPVPLRLTLPSSVQSVQYRLASRPSLEPIPARSSARVEGRGSPVCESSGAGSDARPHGILRARWGWVGKRDNADSRSHGGEIGGALSSAVPYH